MPRYVHLLETASTNTYLLRTASTLPAGTVLHATRQTAGRGQKGNRWESEPGKNLTFSMLIKPQGVPAAKQFCISEATALALADVLNGIAGEGFAIKWPNDIYHLDRKVCGLLIEQSLRGNSIEHSVLGVGLNVNQTQWLGDAPNPVSLAQIAGHTFDLEQLLHEVCERIERECDTLSDETARQARHKRYLAALYRNDGRPHPFALPDGTRFMAVVHDVAPDGTLFLRHGDGTTHGYAFKEVKHIVNEEIL